MKKNNAEELKKKLFEETKSAYLVCDKETADKAYKYCESYVKFLDSGKTERECVSYCENMLAKSGFKKYEYGMKLKKGDKIYMNNRGKNIFAGIIGSDNIENGFTIAASHIDSPRLDLKQHPVYEKDGMAFFKTHYYGGIKKYQWTAIPLAIHGKIILADGTQKDIVIGENENDPIFCINDLLPHLAADQMAKKGSEIISGETLNVLVGSREYTDGETGDAVKLNVLKYLYDNYGMTEADFVSAEIEIVPAFKARDIGFDRSMIGAYGHDDRVCAYPALTALIDAKKVKNTAFVILADKEEIGSEGNTGMQCDAFFNMVDDILIGFSANRAKTYANSTGLSADVSACYDPNFAEAFEQRNTSFINKGVTMLKYTGARGKSATSDASAEYVGKIRKIFEDAKVVWQTSELGRIDIGGGGTVAKYIAKHNIDTVDIGVPVISMHAPYEVVSKFDIYMTYKAILAYFMA